MNDTGPKTFWVSSKRLITGFIFLTGLLFSYPVFSQFQTNCENSNFSVGNWKGWTGCWGDWTCAAGWKMFQCEHIGFHSYRHRIIAAPGYHDPNTDYNLLTVFPGEAYSARLGDTSIGGHAERLMFQLNVSEDDYLFVYRYAVVLYDNNHPPDEQPAFEITITNQFGQILDSVCGYYWVVAQPGLPGWNTWYPNGPMGAPIHWKDWTTVGMNLVRVSGANPDCYVYDKGMLSDRTFRLCIFQCLLQFP